MNTTIKDIARETNLALSTISKYINGGTVRPENKNLIDEAIRKLNYVPSNTARGLRSSKTYRIGLISSPPDNPHNAFLLSRIEKNMRANGYSLLFMSGNLYTESTDDFIPQMLRSGVDGMIITSLGLSPHIRSAMSDARIPVVELEENSCSDEYDCVQTSCTLGAYEIVEHLIQMGHKKIAIINGPDASVTATERKTGYFRAMEDYAIPVNPDYVICNDYYTSCGYEGMMKLWSLKNRPTAVFSTNYSICLGVYEAIYELDIRIPDALSVVSFDDFQLSQMLSPQLTAVRQPLSALADSACELLFRRMSGDYSDYPRRIRLKPECIYRDSVGNLHPCPDL